VTRSNLLRLLSALAAQALMLAACGLAFGQDAEAPETAAEAVQEAADAEQVGESHDAEHDAEHAAEHGAEGDLSHANATAGLTEPQEFKSDLALFTVVVFLLLLAILLKFAWKPIMQGLAKRENDIAENIAQAKKSAADAQAMLAQYEARLAAASAEAQQTIAEARKRGEQAMEKLVAEGHATAQKDLARAQQEIRAAKEMALADLAQRSVNSAVALAGRLVKKEIGPHEHASLIQEALERFPSQN
jgi:F-type H+-transporting ATPase subunit b